MPSKTYLLNYLPAPTITFFHLPAPTITFCNYFYILFCITDIHYDIFFLLLLWSSETIDMKINMDCQSILNCSYITYLICALKNLILFLHLNNKSSMLFKTSRSCLFPEVFLHVLGGWAVVEFSWTPGRRSLPDFLDWKFSLCFSEFVLSVSSCHIVFRSPVSWLFCDPCPGKICVIAVT